MSLTANTIIRRKELPKITGLSIATIYRLIAKEEFPRPVRLSIQAVGWTLSSVNDWLAARPSTKDAW